MEVDGLEEFTRKADFGDGGGIEIEGRTTVDFEDDTQGWRIGVEADDGEEEEGGGGEEEDNTATGMEDCCCCC